MKREYIIAGLVAVIALGGILFSQTDTADELVENASSTASTADLGVNDPAEEGSGTTVSPLSPTKGSTGGIITPTTPAPVATGGKVGTRAKEFVNISGYLNTDAVVQKPNTNVLLLGDNVGKKVILIEFWNYSSLHAQRDIPYLEQWWNRYKNKGLLVVGIHSPEYAFEKDQSSVSKALSRASVSYPVLLDSFLGTWNAYGSKSWPRRMLIDINGNIVMDRVGDGAYEETEKKIQDLLIARATKLGVSKEGITMQFETPKGTFDLYKARIKEVHFGSLRNEGYLGNATPRTEGPQDIKNVVVVKNDVAYFEGTWNFAREYVENRTTGKMIINYGAGRVSLVAGHPNIGRVKVTLNGAPLGERAGKDIVVEKGESYLYVSEDRLYEIVKEPSGYGEHTLEFTAEGNGLQLYKFIFG